MNAKNYYLYFFMGLLLLTLSCTGNTNHSADTPPVTDSPIDAELTLSSTDSTNHSADTPLITGISIDAELTQLLVQIVPYNPPEKYAVPDEKRFLFNLNKLINEDLAEQDEKYKLAAAKLALRTALAITKTVDSIEVRTNHHGSWALGGCLDDYTQWHGALNANTEATISLFTLDQGKIVRVSLSAEVDTCGGAFSGCCGGVAYPPDVDDKWLQHFVDLGKLEGFSLNTAEDIAKIVRMREKNDVRIETLDLRYKTLAEGIADLAKLKGVKHLMIDTSEPRQGTRETEAMREAFFDLFPQLPELETIEMSTGPVTEAQMQKLGECQNLKTLILSHFSTESSNVFAPINRLKNLETLMLVSSFHNDVLNGGTKILQGKAGGTAPRNCYFGWLEKAVDLSIEQGKPTQEVVELHDLPKLTFLAVVGATSGRTFSLTNLPNLTFLLTDAPKVQGDIFTERMPSNLRVLVCSGRGVAEEQIRHIASLEHLIALGLYVLEPDDMDIFSPLGNAKHLQWLSFTFARDGTFLPPSLPLMALMVRFYESGGLMIPALTEVRSIYQGLYVENVTFVDEVPVYVWDEVRCRNTTMSYTQFQSFFTDRISYNSNNLYFDELMLTDIAEDNLFAGFTFPGYMRVRFSPEMQESLKGKTFDYGEGQKQSSTGYMNSMELTVPNLQEVYFRPPGLEKDPPVYWEFRQIE